MQEDSRYVLPALPAGSDPLSQDLYSEQHADQTLKTQLQTLLLGQLPTDRKITTLIVGGRCGFTAELLAQVSEKIDVVEQEPYFSLLKERLVGGREVDYFFGREGEVGERFVLPQPKLHGAVVRVIEAKEFLGEAHPFYDVVLLQNWIVNDKVNLVKDFIKIRHDLLLTTLVPGKIKDPVVFGFLSELEKQVLRVYYENTFHQRVKSTRHITGRREEILFHEVFGWKKSEKCHCKDEENQVHIAQILEKTVVQFNEIKNEVTVDNNENPYETQALVDMYLNFHFGPDNFEIPNYPSLCAKISIDLAKKHDVKGRALDLGCAVGRTSIDLADYFDEVVGIDLSNAFIKAANEVLPSYENASKKVKFLVGNACDLDKSIGKFNLIFGGNLIDRLYDPKAFLLQIGEFLEPNGILILTSPYSWLTEYTPKARWLGGIYENQQQLTTQFGLKRTLEPQGFDELQPNENLRFVIKQNDWVYQYTLANATFWKKL